MTDLYTVYNRRCGHVLGVNNDRALAEQQIRLLGAQGYDLRIRSGASDADIMAVVRNEPRCEACAIRKVAS